MRNKIVGGIVFVWGILALIRWFMVDGQTGAGYYGMGQTLGLVVIALLIVAGGYTFFKGSK